MSSERGKHRDCRGISWQVTIRVIICAMVPRGSENPAPPNKYEAEECMCDGGSDAYLLEFLDGTLVDTTALVDQVS